MSSWSYNWLSWVVHEKMLSKMWVFNWLMMLLFFLLLTSATSSSDYVKPGCDGLCGNIVIPYPFGIRKKDCALNEDFFLNCSSNSTAEELFYGVNIPVRNISLLEGTIIISSEAGYDCYDKSGMQIEDSGWKWSINLGSSGFTFSDSRNKFITIGCDTLAWVRDTEAEGGIGTACFSKCSRPLNLSEKCLNSGCCETLIPKGLHSLTYNLSSQDNYKNVRDFNRCGYAFLADELSFNFSDWHLSVTPEVKYTDVVVEWVVENMTCQQAKADTSAYACGNNTGCDDNDQGYRCKCKEGFKGNPYLPFGCKDIDECKLNKHQCKEGTCHNTPGGYTCRCPFGKHGDGKTGCEGLGIATLAAISGASIFLLIICLLLYVIFVKKMKDQNFRKNGGLVLKHQRVRIFSELEIVKATNNYDSSQKLGEGGFGSVYKGVLADNTQVAIKKFKETGMSKNTKEEFQREMSIVLQVNHKNVVKLLGLCLQTKVPLLVYEYISNGTLSHHIHHKKTELLRTWKSRLRIAAETALALEYLHSLANPPIIHRDIKSVNILLDDNYTAKVADFGASVMMSPGDQNDVAIQVQGTLGYLDPEYLMTGNLTVKSDVYSFGVVLLELLTGEKPSSIARFGESGTIIQYVISSLENNNLLEILDFDVAEGEMDEILLVAELARRCVSSSGVNRPTMKEVSDELGRLKKRHDELWAQQNIEIDPLLDESSRSLSQTSTASPRVQPWKDNVLPFDSDRCVDTM